MEALLWQGPGLASFYSCFTCWLTAAFRAATLRPLQFGHWQTDLAFKATAQLTCLSGDLFCLFKKAAVRL